MQHGTFEFRYLGKFLIDQNHLILWDNLSPYHNNNFLVHDINNDGTAELISADPMKLFGNQLVIFSYDSTLGELKYSHNLENYLYPNPTTSIINIEQDFTTAKVYDISGRELLKTTSKTIDLSELPSSIYLLRLYDNSNKVLGTSKVVKQ